MQGKIAHYFIVILFLFLISTNVFAVIKSGSTPIYAVTTEGQGLVATLNLEIEKGSGKIWTNVSPLVGTSTQNAERTAINVARKYFKDVDSYDFKFSIKSSASVVDGPSAGAAMALLVISMLTDKELPNNVSISGTITQNGQIGPVGGIYEKAKEASKTGIKLFMIPKGEAVQTRKDNGIGSVNLIEYAPKEWGMKVVEVRDIEEALKIAYSDIEKIDINVSNNDAIPEFIPKKMQLQKELADFKLVVTNYIKKAKEQVKEARLGISSSLIEDPELVFALQQTVNNAEVMLQKAEILNEQNYLYSAANFSFLAKSDAILVKEIALNPSILKENVKNFDVKLAQLNKEITQYEKQLAEKIPKSKAEMFFSAQQRFVYAKNSLEELMGENNVTIVISNGEQDYISTNLAKLRKYANAVAWIEVSKDFMSVVENEKEVVSRQDNFKGKAQENMSYAIEEMKNVENEGIKDEAQRRLNSAKTAIELGWYEASLLDSITAKAFLEAEKDSYDKNIEDLNKMLIEKIRETEKKVETNKSVWATLYLAHAKYFLASAEYYSSLGAEPQTEENLRRGISIAYLASEMYDNVFQINQAYEKLPAEKPKEEMQTEVEVKMQNKGFSITPIVVGFGVATIIFIALLVIVSRTSTQRTNLSSELSAAKRKLSEIESSFIAGKLNHENYERLKREWQEKVQTLEKEIAIKTKHLIAYEDYSISLGVLNEKLKSIKKMFKEGMLPKQEFERQSKQIIAEINALEKKLYRETEIIEKEKNKKTKQARKT